MEELTQSTESGAVGAGASTGSEQSATPQMTTQPETDATPNETIYQDPNAPPELTPYEKMEKYKQQGERDLLEGPPDTWHEQIRQRREAGPEGEQQPGEPQAFDLARAYSDFIAKPEPKGSLPLLAHLYESNQPAYAQFISDAVLSQPEYVLGLLADRGLIPADLVPHPGVDPADEWLQDVREDLRDTAQELDDDEFADVMLSEDPNRWLEEKRELQEYRQAKQQRQQQEDTKLVEAGKQAAWKQVESAAEGFGKQHRAHLEKTFQVSGDKDFTAQAHNTVLQMTLAQVMSDPNMMELGRLSEAAYYRAGALRYVGDKKAGDKAAMEAHRYAKECNAAFRSLLDQNVEKLKTFIETARAPMLNAPAQEQPQQYVN